MKAFTKKGTVHPTQETTTPRELLEESTSWSVVLPPIISNLGYFERPLQGQGCSLGLDSIRDLDCFVVRSVKNADDDTPTPLRFQVLTESLFLLYSLTEQTDYFLKGFTCWSPPLNLQLSLTAPSGTPLSPAGDLIFNIVFNRVGRCNKLVIKKKDQSLGSVHEKTGMFSASSYSIKAAEGIPILKVLQGDTPLTTPTSLWRRRQTSFSVGASAASSGINDEPGDKVYFDISVDNQKSIFPCGKVPLKSLEKGRIEFNTKRATWVIRLGDPRNNNCRMEPLEKLLLISAVIYMDLKLNPKKDTGTRSTGFWDWSFLTFLTQFGASICFYFIFLLALATFLLLFLTR